MATMVEIVQVVLPVFLIIALGFGLKRVGMVETDLLQQINRLVFYVALPALLFHRIATADFTRSFNGALLAGLLTTMFLAFVFCYLYGVVQKYPPAQHGAFCQASFRGNLVFVGLAVVLNAYGSDGLAMAGIVLGFHIPLMNLLSVFALQFPHKESSQSMSADFWLYQFSFNPLVLSCFAGILWSFSGLEMVVVLDKTLRVVSGMSLPLALITIGASFSFTRLKGDLRVAGLATLVKLVLLPLATALFLIMFGAGGMALGIGVILTGTPTATASYIMARQLRGDAELTASIIMLSTLLSLFSMTLALYLLSIFKL